MNKDFLWNELNVWDEVVYCDTCRTSRWLSKWVIIKLMDKSCNIKTLEWKNEVRKDYKFIIKI